MCAHTHHTPIVISAYSCITITHKYTYTYANCLQIGIRGSVYSKDLWKFSYDSGMRVVRRPIAAIVIFVSTATLGREHARTLTTVNHACMRVYIQMMMDEFMALTRSDGITPVIEEISRVIGGGPTYLSFDIDALDPSSAPGTGTPEVGFRPHALHDTRELTAP